ncbi:TonB-dependent receptor [Sphingomonas profundi]|uniref:TonB-dependent receptor n=1 Tax=Alterirhizorhabdus profundi TaxID=2681549 RepID=UPI0012E97986|nr:TonB-dependent receptor [Sphingomonas profundi]
MVRSGFLVSSALWTIVVAVPGAAFAQAGETAAETLAPDEIVVTAQRREQSLQDVPISVLVATGDSLRQSQVTELGDLGNRLSGVKVNKAGASDSLNIRGIGSGFNMGFEQSVALFVDGVYLPRSQATRAGFLDLERIEVLKGPQSTYFGSNAIAGALSATTRKPTQTLNGYASALYAFTDGEYDLQGAVGGPLSEQLSGRIAARVSGMNGYIKNRRFDEKGPNNDDVQGRVALRYETPGVLDINLKVDYAKFDDTNSELQEVLNCPPAPGYPLRPGCASVIAAGNADNRLNYKTSTGRSQFNLESVSSALNIALTLGDHTLTSTTGFYHHRIRRFTGSPLLVNATILGLGSSSGLPITQRERFRSISQELRLESDKGGFLEYTLGAYYDDSRLNGGLSYGFYFSPFAALVPPPGTIAAGTPIAERVGAIQNQANRSVFGAATLNFTKALRLNLGARYSSIRKTIARNALVGVGDDFGEIAAGRQFSPTAQAAFAGSVGFPLGEYPVTRRTDDKFMPSVNVQYDLTSSVMAFASYTTGFKAGGWAIGNSRDVFGPETVRSFEGGIKAGWFGNRLTTNVALFNSRYKGLQESTTIVTAAGVPQSVIANVGRARVRGVDFELTARPVRGFDITATVGYLDAIYLEYPNAPCTQLQLVTTPTGCRQNLSGRTKAYAPEWSGSVNANYGFDVTPDIRAKLGSWVYFSSGYYQQASIDPLFYQPNYAKLDLRAAISGPGDRWEVAVIGKNVTDRVTAAYRSVMTASNAVTAITDRARSVAVQVSTKF